MKDRRHVEQARSKNRLDLKPLRLKKRLDSKDVNVERTTIDPRNTKHSRKRVAARNKGSWSSSPLNVTQAAGQ